MNQAGPLLADRVSLQSSLVVRVAEMGAVLRCSFVRDFP
jgi:hypothetical protein